MNEENDDIVIEDDPDSASTAGVVKKLREKLKVAEEKAKEYLDGWQRDRAEVANARKRDEESRKMFIKFANEGFILELMPVLDSFDMALAHGSKEVEPVYKQLINTLKAHGLEVSYPMGEKFDPQQHESIGTISAEKVEDEDRVLEVVQKGYILSGKIIRPAKVKIGQING